MIERQEIRAMPGALVASNNPEYTDAGDTCIEIDGPHYCPAVGIMIGATRGFVQVFLKNRPGLYLRLTPHGARAIAQSLIRSADDMDQQLATAGAQLAAALAKKDHP